MEIFKNGTENRKYPRVPYKNGIKFKAEKAEVAFSEAAQDLSAGGIRLRSSVFIPVGETVSVGIQLQDKQVIEVIGKVVWVRYNPYAENYQLGVEFSQCDAQALSRSRINRLIDSL